MAFLTHSPWKLSLLKICTQQWRSVQHLVNRFWKRWKNEFLSQLQHRNKWQDSKRNLREGDVILLRDKTPLSMA
jgi:hypothetical protein